MDDPFDLDRFVRAQAGAWDTALAELRAGRKRSHWMWFVFPQIAGLGSNPMARRYAIIPLNEARAYLRHPLLGSRLIAGAAAVNALSGADPHAVFGSPDHLKFRTSITLFAAAAPEEAAFPRALNKYFGGAPDPATLAALGGPLISRR